MAISLTKMSQREKYKLAYIMARAYVAGEHDGNYDYWKKMEGVTPAISKGVIERMKFVASELIAAPEHEGLLRKLLNEARDARLGNS